MHRRSILRAGLLAGGAAFIDTVPLLERLAAQAASCGGTPLGDLIGLMPLQGDRIRRTPLGQIVGGTGLDARQFTDLSGLQPDRLITPTDKVFVRTAAPPTLNVTPPTWSIDVQALSPTASRSLTLERLRRDARPMGAHLIECAGNTDPDNFGLLSVAEWEGVPLAEVLQDAPLRSGASGVLVSGVDDHGVEPRTSTPGASWIIPLDALERLGAFLAVGINGTTLTPDHGAPVRLVVPGWYGCSWIKWVNHMRLVGSDEPSTTQMIEFSRRTHQDGIPALARDYEPPVIDLAATPIRVEKRRIDGRIEYRIVGIVWGGARPVDRLMIRFKAGDKPQTFSICPPPATHRTWSLWDYRWTPSEAGVYDIVLASADPSIRTRRLDISFYLRRVIIDDAAG